MMLVSMDNVPALLGLLERVVNGAEPTEREINSEVWKSDDPVISTAANEAWLALRQFVDDADIRSRDKDYEASLRTGLKVRAEELAALLRGEDPGRRRASWLHRLSWRLGLVD